MWNNKIDTRGNSEFRRREMRSKKQKKNVKTKARATEAAVKKQRKKRGEDSSDSESDSATLGFRTNTGSRQLRNRTINSYAEVSTARRSTRISQRAVPSVKLQEASEVSNAQAPRNSVKLFEGQCPNDNGWYDVQILDFRRGRCLVLYENFEDEKAWLPVERIRSKLNAHICKGGILK